MSTETNGTQVDIPEKKRTNPFKEETYLHKEFGQVLKDNRDIIILITDLYGRRGTGKTVSALSLASELDQTDEGMTWAKVSMDAEEIRNAYATLPKGSALVLDEIEQAADNRSAMTKTNKALREIMSMGRVEEKYVLTTVPLRHFVDKDILNMTACWIAMARKGLGLVHELRWEAYSQQLLHPQKQWLEFEDIEKGTQLRQIYNKLTKEKRKRISGEQGSGFIQKKEHQKKLQQAREDARKQLRDELIAGVYNHSEIDASQTALGEATGWSQKTVSNILQRQEKQD